MTRTRAAAAATRARRDVSLCSSGRRRGLSRPPAASERRAHGPWRERYRPPSLPLIALLLSPLCGAAGRHPTPAGAAEPPNGPRPEKWPGPALLRRGESMATGQVRSGQIRSGRIWSGSIRPGHIAGMPQDAVAGTMRSSVAQCPSCIRTAPTIASPEPVAAAQRGSRDNGCHSRRRPSKLRPVSEKAVAPSHTYRGPMR